MQSELLHQTLHRALSNFDLLTVQLPPHFADTIYPEVFFPDPADIDLQPCIPSVSWRQSPAKLQAKGIAADVWSVTSYNLLYRDAMECDAGNRQNPDLKPRIPFLTKAFGEAIGTFVAVSDYMKVLPASIGQWVPGKLVCLGTDGYGLSESRAVLRDHFGISSE